MASSKISQLPVQESSGTTILDELAIVNSGETLTSKITLEAFTLSSGNTIGSTVGFNTGYIYFPVMSFSNNVDNFDRFLSLNSDTASSETNTRQVTDISSSNSFYGNFFQGAIIASNRGMLRNNGNQSVVLATDADSGNNSGILGASQSAVIGAKNSQINGGQYNVMIGTQGGSVFNGAILSGIYSAESCNINGARRSIIAAAYDSNITTAWEFCGILGGRSNNITNNAERRWMMASESSNIDESNNTVILNGYDVDVTGSTEGRTFVSMSAYPANEVSYEWTTHTDNTYTKKVKSFGVVNAGAVSGSIDVDLSTGSLFYFELTGNTTPNFTNWREGQEFNVFVFNNGTHTVPDITITGGGAVYVKGGGVNPTNNERTYYTGTIINGDCWLDEHLNFTAI
jgi:hypothetical protein